MTNFTGFLDQPWVYITLIIWSLIWKGLALWKSAGKKQLIWFIAFLVINTSGLLEILYIFYLNKWDIDNGKLLKFVKTKFSKKNK